MAAKKRANHKQTNHKRAKSSQAVILPTASRTQPRRGIASPVKVRPTRRLVIKPMISQAINKMPRAVRAKTRVAILARPQPSSPSDNLAIARVSPSRTPPMIGSSRMARQVVRTVAMLAAKTALKTAGPVGREPAGTAKIKPRIKATGPLAIRAPVKRPVVAASSESPTARQATQAMVKLAKVKPN